MVLAQATLSESMSWYAISFDGEGLAYARVTRHDRHGTAYILVGSPTKGSKSTDYPTVARLVDFKRVSTEQIVGMLEGQYGNANLVDDDVIAVSMASSRLWADSLVHLKAFESLFGQPHLKVANGHATVYVEARTDLSEASILGRLQGAAPVADVRKVETFDASPWAGLEAYLLTI